MAVTKKTLFAEHLDRYNTFVQDTNPTSRYFNITELPDTFTGGKNAFLIAGSHELVADTLIKIEIKDASGNIIYHEPGEGYLLTNINGESFPIEYYEGVSKVVAVYIYPDTTAYGPCTITILGELSNYYDDNGLLSPIPLEWQGTYNVKWQKKVNVNPTLANTTKVRFYRRPSVSITENLESIYRIENGIKVNSGISQSFANVIVSNINTFAGDVKRVKVYRTSEGDISDYDLIQDILVESKELLTSYELSGSVISSAGFFTSEVLEKLWTESAAMYATLNSTKVDNGIRLVATDNSAKFTYTSSLNLSQNSVYELGIDAVYASATTSSNMNIYISGSNNGEVLVGTLEGIVPTKNLKDSIFQFSLPVSEPTASFYLMASGSSDGTWDIGNLSLRLSEDTAFSPDEVSFITSMPTVIGNETYNFKFEFYDVNNNYVPVAVTASATFTGGNDNIGGTLIYISSSASSSLAQLNAVSSSISGTMTVYSSSASSSVSILSGSVSSSITIVSGSIVTLSGSVSSSISSLSSSVSSSNAIILSSSLSKVQQLANGQYSGSFIGDTVIYSPAIGGQVGYIKELFTVGDTSAAQINLDARTTTRKIYIGTGTYNNTNTAIYLDSGGQFSLKDKLTWDGSSLSVNGSINVTGGNAATQTYANTIGTNAVASGSASATAAQTAAQLFATSIGSNAVLSGSSAASSAQTAAIAQAKADASASVNLLANGNWTGGTGTFITATSISSPVIAGNGGYISTIFKVGNNGITLDGTNKKIYVGTGTYNNANTPFYFASGSTDIFSLGNKLTWDGTTLGVTGNIVITGGATKDAIDAAATAASTAQTTADSKISGAQVNANVTSISGGSITTGTISANRLDVSGIISAGGIIVGGSNISSLTNDSGFQNNGSAKTAGSVGGWTIDSNLIKSNNNQTILYNTGIISLTDGSTERIKITKDNLTTSVISTSANTGASGTNQNLSNTNGTSWNYTNSRTVSYESGFGYSGGFSISQDTLTIAVGYQGSSSGQTTGQVGIGTAFQSGISSLTGYQYSTYTFVAQMTITLESYNGSWNTVSTQVKEIYRETQSGASSGGVSTGYSSGVTAAAFGSLNTGLQHRVGISLKWEIKNAAIAFTFGTVPQWYLYTNQYQLPAQSFSINGYQLSTKLEIGLNGIQISSAGGLTAIGSTAGAGLAGTFTGDVKVQGQISAAAFVASSDERLKTDIKEIESPMVKLSQLNPKSFLWNDSSAPLTNKGYSYGFIAQEVQNYFPDLVKVAKNSSPIENLLTLEYNAIIALNTAAIKELVSKIEVLENRILELEEIIEEQ